MTLKAQFLFLMSKVDVVLGSQWGDEGKGKLVDTIGSKYMSFFCAYL